MFDGDQQLRPMIWCKPPKVFRVWPSMLAVIGHGSNPVQALLPRPLLVGCGMPPNKNK